MTDQPQPNYWLTQIEALLEGVRAERRTLTERIEYLDQMESGLLAVCEGAPPEAAPQPTTVPPPSSPIPISGATRIWGEVFVPHPTRRYDSAETVRDAVIFLHKHPGHITYPAGFERRMGWFTAGTVATIIGLDLSKRYVVTSISHRLQAMLDKGILESMPYKRGSMFRYLAPIATGANSSKQGGTVATRSQPVAGTGSSLKANGDARELLNRIDRRTFNVEPSGSGHIKVTNKLTKAFVVISGTPSGTGFKHRAAEDLRGIGANV